MNNDNFVRILSSAEKLSSEKAKTRVWSFFKGNGILHRNENQCDKEENKQERQNNYS